MSNCWWLLLIIKIFIDVFFMSELKLSSLSFHILSNIKHLLTHVACGFFESTVGGLVNVIKTAFQRIQVLYTNNGIMHNLSYLQVLTSTMTASCVHGSILNLTLKNVFPCGTKTSSPHPHTKIPERRNISSKTAIKRGPTDFYAFVYFSAFKINTVHNVIKQKVFRFKLKCNRSWFCRYLLRLCEVLFFKMPHKSGHEKLFSIV